MIPIGSALDVPRAIYFLSSVYVVIGLVFAVELLSSQFRVLLRRANEVASHLSNYGIVGPRFLVNGSNNSRLCRRCLKLLTKSRLLLGSQLYITPLTEYHNHHGTLAQLHHSEEDFCHLCALLWLSIEEQQRSKILAEDRKLEVELNEPIGIPDNIMDEKQYFPSRFAFQVKSRYSTRKRISQSQRLRVKLSRENATWGNIRIQLLRDLESVGNAGTIYRDKVRPDCLHEQVLLAFESRSTDSVYHINMAHNWLQTCLNSHSSCQKHRNSRRSLPSRLIAIDSTESESTSPIVRLHILNKTNPALEYLTLSHRWGGAKLLTLNKNTYEQFQREIPWEKLSKTLQDALLITQRLGYKYIWIDSLCIIQDSSSDWAQESILMGDIYAGSVLTIAATGSRTSDDGCFMPRNVNGHVDCSLTITDKGEGLRACMCDVIETSFENQVNAAPLNARAWVFQERLLSTRILHYASKMIFWECQTCTIGEHHPYSPLVRRFEDSGDQIAGREWTARRSSIQRDTAVRSTSEPPPATISQVYDFDSSTIIDDYRSAFDLLKNSRHIPQTHEQKHSLTQCWFRLITKYSLGELTISEDKMVAIAGIAATIESSSGMKYLAGLWQQGLPYNLLWFVDTPTCQWKSSRAPSWSWASADGMIKYALDNDFTQYEVISSAEMLSANTTQDSTSAGIFKGTLEVKGVLQSIGSVKGIENEVGIGISYPWPNSKGEMILRYHPDGLDEGHWSVYLLDIISLSTRESYGRKAQTLGLVLTQVSEGVFRRVGYFSSVPAYPASQSRPEGSLPEETVLKII